MSVLRAISMSGGMGVVVCALQACMQAHHQCLIFKHSYTQMRTHSNAPAHCVFSKAQQLRYFISPRVMVMWTLFLTHPPSPTNPFSKLCDIWLFVRFTFTLFISLNVVFVWADAYNFLFFSICMRSTSRHHFLSIMLWNFSTFYTIFSLSLSPFFFYHFILWMCQCYCKNEYNVKYKCDTMMMIIMC